MAGIIFYQGASQLNKAPIVGIATNNSKNIKTGDLIQTWILLQRTNPIEGIKSEKDEGICGNCKHRKGICYVDVSKAPLNVWKSYKNGSYPLDLSFEFFKNKLVRASSYGDPTAIPLKVWRQILRKSSGHTGYTHQWHRKKFGAYKQFCMASVDNPTEYQAAKDMGWRTFRIKMPTDHRFPTEIHCPATPEAVTKLTCETCLFCNGTESKGRKDVAINVHGVPYKISNFSKISLPVITKAIIVFILNLFSD